MKYLLTGQETERLKFRKLQPDDFDTWLPMFKGNNIAKFLDLDPRRRPCLSCENGTLNY